MTERQATRFGFFEWGIDANRWYNLGTTEGWLVRVLRPDGRPDWQSDVLIAEAMAGNLIACAAIQELIRVEFHDWPTYASLMTELASKYLGD